MAHLQARAALVESWRARAVVSDMGALVAKRGVLQAEIAMAELNLEYASVKASVSMTKLAEADSSLQVGLIADVNRQKVSRNGFLNPF